jgi:hypothetical protein
MSRRVLFVLPVVAAAWLLSSFQTAANAPFMFQTNMYGENQVPPVDTQAWGFVRFFFSEDRLDADYTVDVKGLSTTLVEGADIHRGPPGANGPVIRHLADGGFLVTSGHLELTPAELNEMLSGVWYVSLKSKLHPDGEMRGQIIVPDGFIARPAPIPPPPTEEPSPEPSQPPPSSPTQMPSPEPSTGITIRPPSTGDGGLVN